MLDTLPDIYAYERHFADEGYQAICGIDEAGRGPLAGPVVAAAVILRGEPIEGIADSKKLSEKKRFALLPVIIDRCDVGIGIATHDEIDAINILQATFLAMRRAVANLKHRPDLALVDGNQNPGLGFATRAIVKGDQKSASIGAASIVAKCTRDQMMCEAHALYPAYNFAKHKGYGTKEHYEAIGEHGLSPVHRQTFIKPRDLAPKVLTQGDLGEVFAAEQLADMGYQIMARNYRMRGGEVDIVARRGDTLSFVEVKTRAQDYVVSPAGAVDRAKQKRLIKAAQHYLVNNPTDLQPRFDVFEIVTQRPDGFAVASYNLIEGAFDVYETDRHD